MSSNSHEEVVGFNVPVDEVLVVDVLNSANHLKVGRVCVCACAFVCVWSVCVYEECMWSVCVVEGVCV